MMNTRADFHENGPVIYCCLFTWNCPSFCKLESSTLSGPDDAVACADPALGGSDAADRRDANGSVGGTSAAAGISADDGCTEGDLIAELFGDCSVDDGLSLGLDCNGADFAAVALSVLLDRLLAKVFVDFFDFATGWDVCNRAIVPLGSTRLRLVVKQIATIK